MVQLKSMQVILSARDVNEAAKFYREVLGFRIVSEGPHLITLAQGDLRLSLIKAEPGLAPSTPPVQLRFTVSEPQQVDEMASRVKQLNISVLEEVSQQPDGTCAFTCLGPDDHIIQIATELIQPVPVQPVTESPSPLTTPQAAAPQPPTPVQTPVVPPGQPTRADRYWLEAQDRLAKIKEELASLSTSFSQTDIAGTLDEMKQKVAQRVAEVAEKVVTPTDQEAERERKRREAEEALARYKQVVAQEHQQEPAKPTKLEEEGLKPVRKTLGPASDDKPPRE